MIWVQNCQKVGIEGSAKLGVVSPAHTSVLESQLQGVTTLEEGLRSSADGSCILMLKPWPYQMAKPEEASCKGYRARASAQHLRGKLSPAATSPGARGVKSRAANGLALRDTRATNEAAIVELRRVDLVTLNKKHVHRHEPY